MIVTRSRSSYNSITFVSMNIKHLQVYKLYARVNSIDKYVYKYCLLHVFFYFEDKYENN